MTYRASGSLADKLVSPDIYRRFTASILCKTYHGINNKTVDFRTEKNQESHTTFPTEIGINYVD